jgi:hypothetical protein
MTKLRDALEITGFIAAAVAPMIIGFGFLFYVMKITAVAMGIN